MSDFPARLPARPSLEQLRKRAKDLLRAYRAGQPDAAQRFRDAGARLGGPGRADGPTLVDAQFVLAREHGFESWAKLVHHIKATRSPGRLDLFEQLSEDFVLAWRDDADALQRLNGHFGTTITREKLRERLGRRLAGLRGSASEMAELTLADARLLIARQYGFARWEDLVESLALPPSDPRSAPLGLSAAPPFYKIDRHENRIGVRPPLSESDWDTIFGVMNELRLTGLDAGGQMTDAALARLTRLDFVTRLNLEGSTRLSDDGLEHLARMPQLEELNLSGRNSPITDRGLGVLRHLRGLRRFQMCWPQHISDSGAANLARCEHLESVDLLGTPTGDGAINALRGKRALRRFKTGTRVTDAGIPLLHDFPVFKAWQGGELSYALMSANAGPNHLLLDGPITSNGLANLSGLDGLFGFSVFWHTPALTPDGLGALGDLPNLGFLGCEGRLCNDEAMRHIAALPRLRMLMAQGTVAGDEGFLSLSRSQTIEYIWGRECPNLKGRGFATMAAMPALRGLAVSCKNVDDTALSALPRFPALEELLPMDVPDQGFRHVGRCPKLEAVWCMYCRDTGDAATGHISELSRLKTYYAGATKITDRSLEILGRMPSLQSIEFHECPGITDAGLAHLAGLPRLRELTIGGSPNITRAGAALFPAGVRVTYWSS
jgi:hypothetical protein